MKFIVIPQNDDSADDLIYPLDTMPQIDEALIAMVELGIDQLPVFYTSLTIDEFESVNPDSTTTGEFLIA